MEGHRQKAAFGLGAASPRQSGEGQEWRSRRLSAPAVASESRHSRKKEVTRQPKRESEKGQWWVTTRQASWRTAPSEVGYRIDLFSPGWHVQEAPWPQEPVEGWLPVVPRGFVKASELAPAPAEDEPALLTPPPSSSRGSPLSNCSSCSPQDKLDQPSAASARAALLALREEHVRLREANIQLRERELKKRQDLDSLSRARDLTAKELTTVQEELSSSKQDLEHAHEELRVLQKKLELCREAVVTAVKSIDAVYEEVPDEDGKDANLSRDEAQQLRGHQAKQKAANAMDADKAISELLAVVGNPATILPDKEVVEEKYKTSGENADCGASPALEKLLEMKVRCSPTKQPGDQRAPLRDLNRA